MDGLTLVWLGLAELLQQTIWNAIHIINISFDRFSPSLTFIGLSLPGYSLEKIFWVPWRPCLYTHSINERTRSASVEYPYMARSNKNALKQYSTPSIPPSFALGTLLHSKVPQVYISYIISKIARGKQKQKQKQQSTDPLSEKNDTLNCIYVDRIWKQ